MNDNNTGNNKSTIEEAYRKCITQKDYEKFFLEYYDSGHPLLQDAKEQIKVRSKVTVIVRIIACLLIMGAGFGVFQIALLFDGTQSSFLALIGFCSVVATLGLAILGLVVLFNPSIIYQWITINEKPEK